MSEKFSTLYAQLEDFDPKSVEFLSTAIERNALKGFDYIEFKSALHTLLKMGIAEDVAVKSAYVTATNAGLTQEKLFQSIEHYQNVLVKEKRQFEEAMKNQIENKVSQKRSEKIKMNEQILALKAKVSEYQAKITKYQGKLDNSDAEIKADEEKIQATKDKFEQAFDQFVELMNGDATQFKDILGSL